MGQNSQTMSRPSRVASILRLNDMTSTSKSTLQRQIGQRLDLQSPSFIVRQMPMEDVEFVQKHPILRFANGVNISIYFSVFEISFNESRNHIFNMHSRRIST